MLDLLSNNENLIKDYQKQSSVLDTFKKSNLALFPYSFIINSEIISVNLTLSIINCLSSLLHISKHFSIKLVPYACLLQKCNFSHIFLIITQLIL